MAACACARSRCRGGRCSPSRSSRPTSFRACCPSFLPASVVDAASTSLTSLVSERSSLTGPHVRSCRWSVPLPWLAVFQPSHRHVEVQESAAHPPATSSHQETEADVERLRPSVQPAPSSRYLAPMADARRCVARALASVRVADTSLLPLAELEELGRWLEEFHARSYVELDYTGLGSGLVTRAGASQGGSAGSGGSGSPARPQDRARRPRQQDWWGWRGRSGRGFGRRGQPRPWRATRGQRRGWGLAIVLGAGQMGRNPRSRARLLASAAPDLPIRRLRRSGDDLSHGQPGLNGVSRTSPRRSKDGPVGPFRTSRTNASI